MIRYAIGMALIRIGAWLKPEERWYRPVRNDDGTWRFEWLTANKDDYE